MNPRLLEAIQTGLYFTADTDVSKCPVRSVGGGCIHRAYVVESSPPFFVKVNNASCEEMFDAEDHGLKTLAAAGEIRVPCPLARSTLDGESFLALEFIELHGGTPASWRLMGEQLAALHRHTSPGGRFGWLRDNYIGATPQRNRWHDDWISFWREERLSFQLKLAADKGMRFEGSDRLLEKFGTLFLHHAPEASLLHGDLWSGNASFTDEGKPVIYDPACYFGDRECDLAFTEMFGGFPREFYEAYDAAWPREDGWRSRRELYNLYHVLNHANLFGGHYVGQAREMVAALHKRL